MSVLASAAGGVAALGALGLWADRARPCLPILYYHHVHPGETITPEVFERQVAHLARRGWRSLSMTEGIEVLEGKRPFERRTLLLTFDDGWLDNWVFAHPILKRSGLRATLFAVTRLVGEGPLRPTLREVWAGRTPREALPLDRYRGYPTYAEVLAAGEEVRRPFVRWSELAEMEREGTFEVHSHTDTHPLVHCGPPALGTYGEGDQRHIWWTDGDLRSGRPRFRRGSGLVHRRFDPDRGGLESPEAWTDRVRAELVASRRLLEERLGGERRVLCWPFGETSPEATRLAAEAGYRAALTTRKGANTPGMDLLGLHRFEINRARPGWFRSRLFVHAHTPLVWTYAKLHRRFDANASRNP